MSNSRQIHTSLCYILHSRPYQDNSVIIQCLTKDRGLISILSKGARSSKKNLLSLLQPFQFLSISFVGKGELYVLTGLELQKTNTDNSSKIDLTGKSMYCAYYLNELILRLFPVEEANLELFELYHQTLPKLQNLAAIEKELRFFEIRLLAVSGYELNLLYDLQTGEQVCKSKNYYFDPAAGPIEATDNNLINNKHCFMSGDILLAISALKFENEQVLKQAKYLLRNVIDSHLGGKPLKSREVYKQLYAK